MKIINAAVRSNGTLAKALARRRENGFNAGTLKRQSSRQMRQRLNAELRQEVDSMFVEAAEAAKIRRKYDRWSDGMAKLFNYDPKPSHQATVSTNAGARVVREVQVIRKVTVSQFARKKTQVAVLAA
jgi:hypothetical protein